MEMTETMEKGIEDTMSCSRICNETLAMCIEMGGEHSEPLHLQTLMDCAKICEVTANFMMRGSDYHLDLCALCSDVCNDCAESCESFEDEFMQECARECRSCAKSCATMVEELDDLEE